MAKKENKNITISRREYERMKSIEEKFEKVVSYLGHTADIKKSREEVKNGKVLSQENVFKKLGI